MHTSLLSAENALVEQSHKHPDGWGLAYYLGDAPHLVKSVRSAVEDSLFQRVSGIVSSHTVLAHLRKATIGQLNTTNTHPFQYGKWVFAHNGNFKGFAEKRKQLEKYIPQELGKFVLGQTDSELFFHLLLTQIGPKKILANEDLSSHAVLEAAKSAIQIVKDVFGEEHTDTSGPPNENYFTFILTDGRMMISYNGGKELYYSTYKTSCPDKEICSSYAPFCEAPPKDEVRHLVVSSEPLGGPNVWLPIKQGQFVGVDSKMKVFIDEYES